MRKIIIIIFACQFLLSACDEKTNTQIIAEPSTTNLTIKINYTYKGQALELNDKSYVNKALDTFSISNFVHYLSNVTLTNSKNEKYNLGNYNLSYAEYPSTNTITLQGVKMDNWKNMSFLLGVDTVRNHTGAQTGDLSPSKSMYWNWNTGYIFVRFKGKLSNGNNIGLDVGGDDNLVSQSFDLSSYNLNKSNVTITIEMDLNEMFENPQTYNFKVDATSIHTNIQPEATKIKANMVDIAKIVSVQ
ncbi:MAG: hypothetical protein NTU43_13290 [Bacteroidetes bacterium]|nr:hypothetical protein [Bacteroidota bacterium]